MNPPTSSRSAGRGLAVGPALVALACLTLAAPGCLEGGARLGQVAPDVPAAPADTVDTADTGAVEVVAGALSGLRWELPCGAYVQADICEAESRVVTRAEVEGQPGARYRVTARIRGVVEEASYLGGQAGPGLLQIGGYPAPSDWNTYELNITDPPAHFFLNRGVSGNFYCTVADYELTFIAAAGATVTLTSSAHDDQQIPNLGRDGLPLRVAGVPPYPEAFDGQFLQMDVIRIDVIDVTESP